MTIEEARIRIDAIDKELLRLLNDRAHVVNVVGEIKQREGLEIYAPEREEKLLRKLAELNAAQDGKLPEKSIRAIYREIMSAALAIEHPLQIAYLGGPGCLAHQVAQNKFGHGVSYLPHASAGELFQAVTALAADYAVIPREHGQDGSICRTLDALSETALQICAQITVATGEKSRARYFIVGRRGSPATGDDSTLLRLEVSDRVGALQDVLQPFVENGINVRQIENRPPAMAGGEAAVFIIEICGHPEETAVQGALARLQGAGTRAAILGSYPATAWVESLG